MEQFFSRNPYALYFIGLLFLIISNKSNKKDIINKNIIIIYIIFSLVNVFNIINLSYNVYVIMLISFIEIEILSLSNETLVVRSLYKLIDYLFIMSNKYKFIVILVVNIIINNVLNVFGANKIIRTVIWGVYAIFFISTISRIYRNKFSVKSFEKMENIFNRNTHGFDYKNALQNELNTKMKMLIDIEDRTYLLRKRSHSSISLESLMCKIDKITEYNKAIDKIEKGQIKYFIVKFKIIIQYGFKIIITILKALLYKNGVKRFIKRGYSTIEMQWIRNVGIETGYYKVYRRKIFEIIYSNIFFKSLEEKRRYFVYPEYFYDNSKEIYKMLIVYVYLKTVPTFIFRNNERIKINNIYEFYKIVRNGENFDKENVIDRLTREEMFVFIMGLSGKKIDENLFELYDWYVLKYDINIGKVNEIIKKIS